MEEEILKDLHLEKSKMHEYKFWDEQFQNDFKELMKAVLTAEIDSSLKLKTQVIEKGIMTTRLDARERLVVAIGLRNLINILVQIDSIKTASIMATQMAYML
ncbi:hypothetical protein KY320_01575 [Candidatus Woesearchaeota archaeon]|nr:hypothetical protein [Candidatus Woesearchaeota archaeon]